MSAPTKTEEKKQKKRPTAEKRQIQNEKKRIINKDFKSKIRSARKNFLASLAKKDSAASKNFLKEVYSLVDKGVKRSILKKNASSRIKSRLAAKLAKMG